MNEKKYHHPFTKVACITVASILIGGAVFILAYFNTDWFYEEDQLRSQQVAYYPTRTSTSTIVNWENYVDVVDTTINGPGTGSAVSSNGGNNYPGSTTNVSGVAQPTTAGPATSVTDAGISTSGQQSTVEIEFRTKQGELKATCPLWTGIPEQWAAKDTSMYFDFSEVAQAWLTGYNSTFGHDYPNSVKMNGWHSDDNVTKYSAGHNYSQSGPVFDVDGVPCVGFCPVPYYLDGNFRWDGISLTGVHDYYYVVVVQNSSGDCMYLPAVTNDAKAHIWPGGVAQTYIRHQTDGGTFDMAKGAKNDAAYVTYDMSEALSYLEDGTAGSGYGSDRSSVVQFSVEGYWFGYLNYSGWDALGVIRVER